MSSLFSKDFPRYGVTESGMIILQHILHVSSNKLMIVVIGTGTWQMLCITICSSSTMRVIILVVFALNFVEEFCFLLGVIEC